MDTAVVSVTPNPHRCGPACRLVPTTKRPIAWPCVPLFLGTVNPEDSFTRFATVADEIRQVLSVVAGRSVVNRNRCGSMCRCTAKSSRIALTVSVMMGSDRILLNKK